MTSFRHEQCVTFPLCVLLSSVLRSRAVSRLDQNRPFVRHVHAADAPARQSVRGRLGSQRAGGGTTVLVFQSALFYLTPAPKLFT